MPGPPRKEPERRQNRTTRDLGLVPQSAPVAVPAAPSGLLKATRDRWATFWQSKAASLVMDADMPALERLFQLLDERERCQKSANGGRLVEGSQGQPVLNPLYKHLAVIDAEIRQLEDRFGLTPMARLKLGVTFGEAHRSLADLNAEVEDDGGDDDDPRFGIINGAALA